MIEAVLLAIVLSMDAFAVAIGLGSKQKLNPRALALLSGVYFSLFKA